ncbi:hypothetical protein IGI04_030505 [Brassica rapa subsp. trilocularis]|uniref:Uncharacterized protein n=1 Tax=Brassica rapa subsp. trilocularis TaxID=1813537 RepID=A0ABQ7LU86_BRACM|nr:hypothetical protein IGI04_030505 [Brassica rapa subsp. trilocularis]
MASWSGRTELPYGELVGTARARHMASLSGQTELAIWHAGRDMPSSPYGELVGTVLALPSSGGFGQSGSVGKPFPVCFPRVVCRRDLIF